MTKRIKACLIGCGRISPNHVAAAYANREKMELAAVCDLVPAHMEQTLASSSFPAGEQAAIRRYTGYQEMLQAEKPDLVAIATESGSHAAIAMDAIAAGCNLIVEKPVALSLSDADAMIAAAKVKGLLLCANHQNRFNKPIRRIREALEAGRFGRLLHGAAHIRWSRGRGYFEQAPWRGTWAQDGGALMNQCIHCIDLLRWMMGDEVTEVMAYTDRLNHPYIEAEDLGLALVKFKNGSYGLIEGTTNVFPKNLEETLYLFGETGTVKAGGKAVNTIEEWSFADQLDDPKTVMAECSEAPVNVYGFGHTKLYADVLQALSEGHPPYVDGEAGRRALELVLAIYKSAKEGRPVRLPLTDFSTMDMAGRFDR